MATQHGTLTFFRGDTWEIPGEVNKADGSNLDLSGGVVEWELETLSGESILLLTQLTGITIVDPTQGVITVNVTPEQSALIVEGQYHDQLRVTDATGHRSTQWQGMIAVLRSQFEVVTP